MFFQKFGGKGGNGGVNLAKKVKELAESEEGQFKYLYDLEQSIKEKIEKIAKSIYGAEFSSSALKQITMYEDLGYSNLAIYMAKTQYSLSDNAKLLGRPSGFTINIG